MTEVQPIPSTPATSPANIFDLAHFVVTDQVRRVIDFCQVLQDTRTLGMLVGLPGVGKTWAAQYAAEHQPQPEEITASPVLYTSVDVENTPRVLLSNLLDCLGPDYRAPVPDMTKLTCCWIHRRQVELIILDKAAELDKTSWKIVQDIHDRTRCAFLFIGPTNLSLKLRKLPEVLNRIGLTLELPLLSFDELVEFLYQWQKTRLHPDQARVAHFTIYPDQLPDDIEMVKDIYRVTMGNLRRACYIVQEAERIAKVNGQYYVDPPVMQATIRLLLGESTW
jgi:DNA transposition AAA+ family ATPase